MGEDGQVEPKGRGHGGQDCHMKAISHSNPDVLFLDLNYNMDSIVNQVGLFEGQSVILLQYCGRS